MKIHFLILSIFFLVACQSNSSNKTTVFSGIKMTIPYRILIGKKLSKKDKKRVEEIIQNTFYNIDLVYNKYNPSSELSRINQQKEKIKTKLSSELYQFLLQIDEIVKITEGKFDPTIEPLQQLWRKRLELGKIPSDEEILELSKAIGWEKIHLEEGYFWKDHSLTQLDLGGIAKGYCVDQLVERLSMEGYSDLFVEWGGEIRSLGKHPSDRPWNIFISRLDDINFDSAVDVISLNDQAIATSGNYFQNWTTENSETFTHIINPKTYYPLKVSDKNISQVAVLAPTCLLADTLATTAMMFPSIEEAQNWLESLEEDYKPTSYWLTRISSENPQS